MHLENIEIKNIKSINNLNMDFESAAAGWHVLLGNNGSGKSTILQAISLALMGSSIQQLRENWDNWISFGKSGGQIYIKGQDIVTKEITIPNESGLRLQRYTPPNFIRLVPSSFEPFSLAYGPNRRFEGDDRYDKDLKTASVKIARHATLFKPGIALPESITWLQTLKFQSLESGNNDTLDRIVRFINNSEALPSHLKISKVNSTGVFLNLKNQGENSIFQLSDGYKSFLSKVLDIIKKIHEKRANSNGKYRSITIEQDGIEIIDEQGVILIDEVDVHLHPSWQVNIGHWFKKYFPNIQFIVTTHSPIICQAADSIWKLADMGTNETSRKVEGIEFKRLKYGNVLEAYGTDAFGKSVTRSETSHRMLDQLARLNMRSIRGEITEEEQHELNRLKAILPTQS